MPNDIWRIYRRQVHSCEPKNDRFVSDFEGGPIVPISISDGQTPSPITVLEPRVGLWVHRGQETCIQPSKERSADTSEKNEKQAKKGKKKKKVDIIWSRDSDSRATC